MDIIIFLLLIAVIGMIVIFRKKYVPQKGGGLSEYKKEKYLYKVTPLVKETSYWENLSEVTNIRNQKKISFDSIRGKELLANFLTAEDVCKLYIIDEESVELIYVPSNSLNPSELIRVTQK